jgi:hypothetical protein
VAGDFNAGKIISFLPTYHLCNQRQNKITTIHLYSTQTLIQSSPSPSIGKSDHNSILLIPAYKQKLKQEVLVTHSIWKWSDEADAKLQVCFANTDWNIFRESSDGIEV